MEVPDEGIQFNKQDIAAERRSLRGMSLGKRMPDPLVPARVPSNCFQARSTSEDLACC